MNLMEDGENIMKCKEMIDNSFKYFQVSFLVYCPSLLSYIFTVVYVHLAPIGYGGFARQ